MINDKNRNYIGVVFILTIIFAYALILYFPIKTGFPFLKYDANTIKLELIPLDPFDNISSLESRFLWDKRALDLIIQSFVLFSAVVCCLALLKAGAEEK